MDELLVKEVRISLSESRRTLVDNILKEFNIEPRVSLGTHHGENEIEWSFRLPSDYTNTVIEKLKGIGVGVTYGSIYMMTIDFLLDADEDHSKVSAETSMGANFEEILFSLSDAKLDTTYIILAILSAILAGYGIATQSEVIIIGAMIVAPLLGPIALTSLGLLTPGKKLLKDGLLTEGAGLLITVLTGVVVGFSIMIINLFTFHGLGPTLLGHESEALIMNPCINSQMLFRTRLDIPTVVLAIFSGLAAGLIISKGMNVSIVGVAIAASIAPPATNIGMLGSAYMASIIRPDILVGQIGIIEGNLDFLLILTLLAAAFLLLNIIIINVSISIVLWAAGVASRSGVTRRRKGDVIRTNLIWISFLVLVAITLFILSNVIISPQCTNL